MVALIDTQYGVVLSLGQIARYSICVSQKSDPVRGSPPIQGNVHCLGPSTLGGTRPARGVMPCGLPVPQHVLDMAGPCGRPHPKANGWGNHLPDGPGGPPALAARSGYPALRNKCFQMERGMWKRRQWCSERHGVPTGHRPSSILQVSYIISYTFRRRNRHSMFQMWVLTWKPNSYRQLWVAKHSSPKDIDGTRVH